MRYPTAATIASHVKAVYQEWLGSPSWKCTTAAITPAPAGIGIPTKYFFPGRPGFDGCGLEVILKRPRRLALATRTIKQQMPPNCVILICHPGSRTGPTP